MGYVIAAIVVVLLIAGLVGFLVTNSTRKSNVSDAGDPGADQNPAAIVGSDEASPLGSTDQHADEENDGARDPHAPGRPDVAPPVVGGEAEGRRTV
jgi:hypothetical protein